MNLIIADSIFIKFPGTVLGVVIGHGLDNTGSDPELIANLRAAELQAAATLSGSDIPNHPHIAPWREAYRQFGANPKDYPTSIENLVRRASNGHSLPHINKLVDLYNSLSLRCLLPYGGEDLAKVQGDIWLTMATQNEQPVKLLGEREERPPKPGEVFYKDELGAICRRWNWKEADRTKLTDSTREAVFVVERLPPIKVDLVEQGVRDLADGIQRYCGGAVRVAILNRDQPSVQLS